MSGQTEAFLKELAELTKRHNLIISTFGEAGRVMVGFCVWEPLPNNEYSMHEMGLNWDSEAQEYRTEMPTIP